MKSNKVYTEEDIVEKRLKHFIDKYYRVRIFQGLIVTVSAALVILFFIIVFGNFVGLTKVLRNFVIGLGIILLLGIF